MLKTDWMELREHYSVGILVDNRPHVIIPVSLVSPGVHIVNAWSVPPHQGNILSPAASSTSALIQVRICCMTSKINMNDNILVLITIYVS